MRGLEAPVHTRPNSATLSSHASLSAVQPYSAGGRPMPNLNSFFLSTSLHHLCHRLASHSHGARRSWEVSSSRFGGARLAAGYFVEAPAAKVLLGLGAGGLLWTVVPGMTSEELRTHWCWC